MPEQTGQTDAERQARTKRDGLGRHYGRASRSSAWTAVGPSVDAAAQERPTAPSGTCSNQVLGD